MNGAHFLELHELYAARLSTWRRVFPSSSYRDLLRTHISLVSFRRFLLIGVIGHGRISCLEVDYKNASVWMKYGDMEIRHGNVNHARHACPSRSALRVSSPN